MEIKTVDELKEAFPELAAQITADATAAERKRIQDIEGIALPGYEDVISKAKFEAPATAAEVAVRIVAEQKKQGAAYLADVNEDVKNSGATEVTPGGHEGAGGIADPYGAAIDKLFPANK